VDVVVAWHVQLLTLDSTHLGYPAVSAATDHTEGRRFKAMGTSRFVTPASAGFKAHLSGQLCTWCNAACSACAEHGLRASGAHSANKAMSMNGQNETTVMFPGTTRSHAAATNSSGATQSHVGHAVTLTLVCTLSRLLQDFTEVQDAHKTFLEAVKTQSLLHSMKLHSLMGLAFGLSQRLCALVQGARKKGVDFVQVQVGTAAGAGAA
jgi:hypothetical protein